MNIRHRLIKCRGICRLTLILLAIHSCPLPAQAPILDYRVVASYPHDSRAYTQGLVYHDGVLYEGTGQKGASSLRKVDPASGMVIQYHELAQEYFGEGVTIFDDRIIQLTWRSNIGFSYDLNSFILIETFHYPKEGWGLTTDGQHLIMSDGSEDIFFLDPVTYADVRKITVTDNGKVVGHLNELEYVEGEIFANVYPTNKIARIDPADGRVLAWIDLAGILSPAESQGVDVLNGIAYDAAGQRLFVTGKWWPTLFQIEVIDQD